MTFSKNYHQDENRYRGLRYICLARQSDDSEGATSTQAQLKFARTEGDARGMVYVDAVILEGVTGSLPGKRKDLKELLQRKREKNDFDVLVVQLMDRLTRGGSEHGFWFEHECHLADIILLYIGEDVPEGPYANMIKAAKYDAAREQARSISQRSVQGAVFALNEERNTPISRTPYGCWRLYFNAEGEPQFFIRNLRDGRQQKLNHETRQVIDTYGSIGGGTKGHYRKQKSERVCIVPGDENEVAVVVEMMQLRWIRGLGGSQIADRLNRRGIPSPMGKPWSQNQVESICDNPIYFGWALGCRRSQAIYHQQGADGPEAIEVDPTILAGSNSIPRKLRSPQDWRWKEEPFMADYLPAPIREIGFAKVKQRLIEQWERSQDPTRPKKTTNKHKESQYILTELMFCKQDGEKMVGILTGRKGKEVRRYRNRRGHRDYQKGSIFNRTVLAEPLESAVLDLVHQMVADAPFLRQQLLEVIGSTAPQASDGEQLDELRQRRQKLATQFQRMLSLLSEEDHQDAAPQLDRLRTERRELDRRIAELERAVGRRDEDPHALADRILEQLERNRKNFSGASSATKRRLLEAFIERVEVDLENRDVEVWLQLPSWMAIEGNEAGCLAPTLGSSTSYETPLPPIRIAYAHCRYERILTPGKICYHCKRTRPAA